MLPITPYSGNYYSPSMMPVSRVGSAVNPSGIPDTAIKGIDNSGKTRGVKECQTCSSRQYQDGSDENVSFKSPAHISPEASASVIRGHEQEHVSNAYTKAAQKNGRVLSATVSLETSVCPECGRSYVSGGVTRTSIQYSNEENQYQKDMKNADAITLKGNAVDKIA